MVFKAEFLRYHSFYASDCFRSEELGLPDKVGFCLRKNKVVVLDSVEFIPKRF